MGLKIIISSAVALPEKTSVKEHLKKMEEQNLINISSIYDCNEHATILGGGVMGGAKQETIDKLICEANWFICLAPYDYVGEATAEELKLVCKAVMDNHRPIVISVFHSFNNPEKDKNKGLPNYVKFDEMFQASEQILQRPKDQYYVGYEYDSQGLSLLSAVVEEYKKLFFKDRLFFTQRLDYFVKSGAEVLAAEFFFDTQRAKPENGFKPFYIYRQSVDGRLHQRLYDLGYKFLFVTGKPSSGKSRALLECAHTELREKRVVVMRTENVKEICRNFLHELELNAGFDGEYYFLCDQVKDVLQSAGDALCKAFLTAITEVPNCRLIGSSTANALQSFIADNPAIDNTRNGNAYVIDIPLLTRDADSKDIMSQIWLQYPRGEGETIGDFITELRDYKNSVAQKIIDKVQKDGNIYMAGLLQSLQLVMVFRRTSPLFLAVMLLRHLRQGDDEGTFKEQTAACINYLLTRNVIWVNNTEEHESRDAGFSQVELLEAKDFQFLRRETYDNERFKSIIPTRYMFTVNELIWEVLEEEEDKHLNPSWTSLFFNLYDSEGLRQAIYTFYETFPTPSSLRRILPRLPRNKKWQERKAFERRLAETWDFVFEQLKELDPAACDPEELLLTYEMLIGRASSLTDVNAVMADLPRTGTPLTPACIGELYLFAKVHLDKGTPVFQQFISRVQSLKPQKDAFSLDEVYRITRELSLLCDDFDQALASVKQLFGQIQATDEMGLPVEGMEAIRQECRRPDSKAKMNIIRLITLLASPQFCQTMPQLAALIVFCSEIGLELPIPVFYAFGRVARTCENILSLFNLRFPTEASVQQESNIYEYWTAYTLVGLDNFGTSIALYQRFYQLCGLTKHNDKMLSLCLQNCQQYEFGDALKYILTLPQGCVHPISLNILISKSPTVENAYFIINMMRPEDCDEYTLSNCMNLINNRSNSLGARKRHVEQPLNAFFNAYEFVNHPKLKPFRTKPACLRFLYQFAANREQEAYINRLVQEESPNTRVLMNPAFSTTLILKQYRTFSQAYHEIFTQAFSYVMDLSGKVEPDIFNCMCSLYCSTQGVYKQKEKDIQKLAEKDEQQASVERSELEAEKEKTERTKLLLLRDIDAVLREKKIFLDEHFFLNYHLKMMGQPIVNEDGTEVTPFFRQWFMGEVGNADFFQNQVLQQLIHYFLNRDLPSLRVWTIIKTLYLFFQEHIEERYGLFRPSPELMSLLIMAAERKYKDDESGDTQDFAFIDQELIKRQVLQDRVLNKNIRKLRIIYKFKYTEIEQPFQNLHAYRNMDIQSATSVAFILQQLDEEMEQVGTINPTLINSALENIRDIHRFHSLFLKNFIVDKQLLSSAAISSFDYDAQIASYRQQNQQGESGEEEVLRILKYLATQPDCHLHFERTAMQELAELQAFQYQHIKDLIEEADLQDKLTFRNYTQLALVCRTIDDRKEWLHRLEQTDDFSCISLGQLGMERIIAIYDINVCRKYFTRWLDIFQDIYQDNATIAKRLPPNNWSTIGTHLRWELETLVDTIKREEKRTGKELWIEDIFDIFGREKLLGAATCIARIYQLYSLTSLSFRQNPFQNIQRYLNFKDSILFLSLVMPDRQAEWQEMEAVLGPKFG